MFWILDLFQLLLCLHFSSVGPHSTPRDWCLSWWHCMEAGPQLSTPYNIFSSLHLVSGTKFSCNFQLDQQLVSTKCLLYISQFRIKPKKAFSSSKLFCFSILNLNVFVLCRIWHPDWLLHQQNKWCVLEKDMFSSWINSSKDNFFGKHVRCYLENTTTGLFRNWKEQ